MLRRVFMNITFQNHPDVSWQRNGAHFKGIKVFFRVPPSFATPRVHYTPPFRGNIQLFGVNDVPKAMSFE